ncbi:MAG: hypothetical protein KDJ35_02465 [Alphaproteobacteria bacterium]|nr:hypothetical protein [Alphaproteobacteria bacterium]
MQEFKTSLLREKFIIEDKTVGDKASSVTALSNRMVVSLENKNGALQETFVIRTHNMHSCTRMATKILQTFTKTGPLMNRSVPIKWEELWEDILSDFERSFNPDKWLAIYNAGKPVFKAGDNIHPFLDLIERCDYTNKGEYEDAIPLAESAFVKTGKTVKIAYDGNVALVVNFDHEEARCGVILRGPDRTTTFNFNAHPGKTLKTPDFVQCLGAAAAFLEGMQLAFMIGMDEVKIRYGLIERNSREEKKTQEGRKRLGRLSAIIGNLEITHTVRYRPERPEFKRVISDAEKLAQKILTPAADSGYVE